MVDVVGGDSQIWENSWGRLEVYPRVSTNILTQVQYCNATWYKSDTWVDLVFRFDCQINNPGIWLWRNMSHDVVVDDFGWEYYSFTLYNITDYIILDDTPDSVDLGYIPSDYYACGNASWFDEDDDIWRQGYVVVGFDSYDLIHGMSEVLFYYKVWDTVGSHVEQRWWDDWFSLKDRFDYEYSYGTHNYHARNLSLENNVTYQLKWQYTIPEINQGGKWELMGKLHNDSIQDALNNDRYICLDPWWDSNWEFFRVITVDSGNLIGNPVQNFPLLIVLDNSSGDFMFYNSGADIRFINLGNTSEYYYEIESFDNSGSTYCWVNCSDDITTGSRLLVYYGNPSASDNQNKENVWHSAYKGVWHMTNASDSTSNNVDWVNNGVSFVAGMASDCGDFELDDTDNMFYAAGVDIVQHDKTLECFLKAETLEDNNEGLDDCMVTFREDMGLVLCWDSTVDKFKLVLQSTGTNPAAYGPVDCHPGFWYHLVGVHDYINPTSQTAYMYVNSTFVDSDNQAS